MKPELTELPVLATLSSRRFISSLSSKPDPDNTPLPSWLCPAHIHHVERDEVKHHCWLSDAVFQRGLPDSPCRRRSRLFCPASSWTDCRICRIPLSSLTGLPRQHIDYYHCYDMWRIRKLKNTYILKDIWKGAVTKYRNIKGKEGLHISAHFGKNLKYLTGSCTFLCIFIDVVYSLWD